MNNIIFNQEYNIPYSTTPLTSDTVEEYLDNMKNFFVNILGFYPYGERQIYNSCFVDYYSNIENGEPCFCFAQLKSNAYTTFGIVPCLYGTENEYYPKITSDIQGSRYIGICQYNSTIIFNTTDHQIYNPTTVGFYPIVKCIYLNDGRKLFFFINQYRGDNTGYTVFGYKTFNFGGCLYFTNIKQNNEKISNDKKCIIISDSFNTSYFQEIQGTASQTKGSAIHEKNSFNFINPRLLITSSGYIPDRIIGKDFLLKIPQFYIGDEYYLEEISFFSDLKSINDGYSSAGKIIKIENKEYIILYNQPPYKMDNIMDTSNQFFNINVNDRGSYTSSLIIPTDDLED